MGGDVGVTVTGDRAVMRDLRAIADDVTDLRVPLQNLANEGARVLAGFTPRRTGRLAGTARGVASPTGLQVTQGSSTVVYAGPVNYGWRARNIRPARQLQRTERHLERAAPVQLDDHIDESIKKRGLA